QPNQTRTLTALVLTKPGGFGSKARHQGHWHKANQKTEAFAINAKLSGDLVMEAKPQ
ncbi:hypothetical protein BY454_1231, partial [Marinobacter persicus]